MGAGASSGLSKALAAASLDNVQSMVAGLTPANRDNIVKAIQGKQDTLDDPDVAKYIKHTLEQWEKVLDNPSKLIDTAASKRSPFKFERGDSKGVVDLNLGSCCVALPDAETDFGKRYLKMIDTVQDLFAAYIAEGCKRQTTPHMSIGSVMLDKNSPKEYNDEVRNRSGLISKVKAQLDSIENPPRAKIQTLKINPDGCVTFQLEHDPSQDIRMTEAELEVALKKIPTCNTDEAAANERRKFKKNEDGTYTVSRFQQVRLALGSLGCEIKGMWPSGHMVVVNLTDVKVMQRLRPDKLKELMKKCREAWQPLMNEWFELKQVICLCYVERSLNEGSVVVAPPPGDQPKAFPEASDSAQALLGGIFTSTPNGDVLIDIEKFNTRKAERGKNTWLAFNGEVREMAENHSGVSDLLKKHPSEKLKHAFQVYDKDCSGFINSSELGNVMEKLGERVTDDELKRMMTVADQDGSGEVSFLEFVDLMASK